MKSARSSKDSNDPLAKENCCHEFALCTEPDLPIGLSQSSVGICCGYGCRSQMTGPCPPFLLSVTAVSKSATVAESLLKERVWSRRCHPELLLQGLAGAGEGRQGQSPKVLCA